MRYLCVIYGDEDKLEALSGADTDAILSACATHCAGLRERGQLIASARLAPVPTATTVRIRNGTPTVTDGPFAETKEHLAGFYLIEARDLNDAIRIAAAIPPAQLGCVEVRPVTDEF